MYTSNLFCFLTVIFLYYMDSNFLDLVTISINTVVILLLPFCVALPWFSLLTSCIYCLVHSY